MTTYLIVMGWAFTVIIGAVLVRYAQTRVTGRRRPRKRPQVGDGAIAMVSERQADDRFIAALELELAEMDKQIRGDLGG